MHTRHRTIEANRQIGLLLPCNVVVRTDPDHEDTVLVEAINPAMLVAVAGEPGLGPLSEEVTDKLRAAIDWLSSTAPVTAGE